MPAPTTQNVGTDAIMMYYANTQYSSITTAQILTDLDGILSVTPETLPVIEFLKRLYYMKSLEDQSANIVQIEGYLANLCAGMGGEFVHGNIAPTTGYGTMNDFDDHKTNHTLTAGAITNAVVYSPSATDKAMCHYIYFGTNNTTNPNTTYYLITLSAETSGTIIHRFVCRGDDLGKVKIPIHWRDATVNQDILISVAGGVGTEVISVTMIGGGRQ